MNIHRSARRRRNDHRDAADVAGTREINLSASRYPAYGDHHRHPHRAMPEEPQL